MGSQLDHERGRAVEAATQLLKFVAGYVHLDVSSGGLAVATVHNSLPGKDLPLSLGQNQCKASCWVRIRSAAKPASLSGLPLSCPLWLSAPACQAQMGHVLIILVQRPPRAGLSLHYTLLCSPSHHSCLQLSQPGRTPPAQAWPWQGVGQMEGEQLCLPLTQLGSAQM